MPNTRKKEVKIIVSDPESEGEETTKRRHSKRGRALSQDAFKHNMTKYYDVILEEPTSKVKTSYYWDHAKFVPLHEETGEIHDISCGSVVFGWSYSCPLVVIGFSSLHPQGKTSLGVIVRDIFQIDENYQLPSHIHYKHPNKKNRLKASFNDQKPYLKITVDSLVKNVGVTYSRIVDNKEEHWKEMLFYFEHFARKGHRATIDTGVKSYSKFSKSRELAPLRRSPRKVKYTIMESDTEETSENEEEIGPNSMAEADNNENSSNDSETSSLDDNEVKKALVVSNPTQFDPIDIKSSIELITNEISRVHARDVELIKELIQQQNESRKYLQQSHDTLLKLLSKRKYHNSDSSSDEETQQTKKQRKL